MRKVTEKENLFHGALHLQYKIPKPNIEIAEGHLNDVATLKAHEKMT